MASTYLSKTFAQAGNRRTFTISYWIKMGQVSTGADQAIMGAAQDGSNSDDLYIHTGRLNFSGYYGSTAYQVRTTAKYRDLSGWYHHVIRFDSTQSTASDRLRLYVNGELQTALDDNTYPSQNLETTYFNTARQHTIGSIAHSAPNLPFNGSMSHFHFCDGYSYGADSFGSTDATTGEWKINTSPSVSYGTNGFFILKNGNSVTDQSGQGNNWSVGGGTLTKTEDNPSNVFATLNPLNVPTSNAPTFANGNTTSTSNTASGSYKWGGCSTLGMTSGKFYCEAKATVDSTYSRNVIGITGDSANLARTNGSIFNTTYSWGYYSSDGSVQGNGSGNISGFSTPYVTGDIIMMALDLDNNKFYFGRNGTWLNSGVPTSGNTGTGAISITSPNNTTDGAYFFAQTDDTGTTSPSKFEFNFGNGYFGTTAVSSAGTNASNNGIFEYDVPTGYTALSTKGLNL